MKKRVSALVLILALACAAALGLFIYHFAYRYRLLVIADPFWEDTVWAQAEERAASALGKNGWRVEKIVWDDLPADRNALIAKAGEIHADAVLTSPVVTSLFARWGITEEQWPGVLFIGVSEAGTKSPLYTYILAEDPAEGLKQAAAAAVSPVLLYHGKDTEAEITGLFPGSEETEREQSDAYAVSRMDDWKERGIGTIIFQDIADGNRYTGIPLVVPALDMLSVSKSDIRGLLVPDYGAILPGLLASPGPEDGSGEPVRVLVPTFFTDRPRMRGGWLRLSLRDLRRKFL